MFEDNVKNSLFTEQSEKTFIDKVLARDDVNRIRELVKKPSLVRSDLLELLYLLAGTESKLVNFSEWDRYVTLKFYVWIREFIKIAELLFDYHDDLQEKQKKGIIVLNERSIRLLKNCQRLIEHNAKFLIDLYLNINRTTLSIGATGMLELLKNKYEVIYPYGNPATQQPPQDQKNILRFKK